MVSVEKLVIGELALYLELASHRGATTREAHRKIYLSSQHSSLALRSAIWRLERTKAAQALVEAANNAEFVANFGEVVSLWNRKEEDKK